MASVKPMQVDARDIAHRITLVVEVRGLDRLRRRMRIAAWLCRLAAWIAGFGFRVDAE